MKKLSVFLILVLVLGTSAFAKEYYKEDNGALGLGLLFEPSSSKIQSNIRGSGFLDIGTHFTGPLYYGFELYLDVKKLGEDSVNITQRNFSTIVGSNFVYTSWQDNSLKTTITLWDTDFSPRAYVSIDLNDQFQLHGFAGVNFNWQTLETILKAGPGGYPYQGKTYREGETIENTSKTLDTETPLSVIIGARATLGLFYLDYTRFLKENSNGDLTLSSFSNNRLGLGINLRW